MESSDFASEFKRVLSLIYPPYDFPDLYCRIFNFNWLPNPHHQECFQKHCVDVAHRMDALCRRDHLLQEIWKEDITYAYLVGFLHDIGKPFVTRINFFGQQGFRGHAQVGARLVTLRFQDEIPEDVLLTMGVLIDCHMCCLRNLSFSSEHRLRVNAILHMYLPPIPHLLSLLMCLHSADQSSKQPPFQVDGSGYLYQAPFTFRKDRRVVIFLLGPMGSGKSTIARALTEKLASCGSVLHLQRDEILMTLATKGESYSSCYYRIRGNPALKRQLQTLWQERLDSASADIILVDTCQTYFWSNTIGFENCFRIGLYCVPFNLFDPEANWRNPRIEFPPEKWSGYPSLLMEQCPWSLEVGTGLWNLVPSLVKRYFDQLWPESLEHHPSLATLWNESFVSKICAQFPFKGIHIEEEFSLMDHKVYRATYPPGMDVTWGPTRFYRGEFLLQKENTKRVYPLRSGLPTFSRHQTLVSTFDHVVVTPKFDGSLVNILFIPLQHPYYKLLQTWFYGDRNEFGLFLVGSKQKLVMDSHLRKKFNTVMGSKTFDTFISSYDSYFEDQDCLKTLHFEMMTEADSTELNVYYPENSFKFIGCTTFTNDYRRFTMAKPSDARAISQKSFQTKEACEAYLEELHDQFLKGDTLCEPEGCVLYFWDARGCLLDVVKSKFPEYLAVINPNKYPKQYQETLTNPLLAQRFQKIRKLKKDLDTSTLKKAIHEFLKKDTKDRKEFALYVEENRPKIQEFQVQLEAIAEKARIKARNVRQEIFLNYPYVQKTIENIFRPLDEIVDEE
ncbi:uncharacterized protein TNCT_244131 [Trichonephila clavata]|uniref:HD domain-containing protein n=1 Tax=Trichonephila clavata TaxID=2740835 RepID=A0A8X6G7J9_TRICU|nr:uncharacterized protein TNCT_244131 [Trichonephila clavata]